MRQTIIGLMGVIALIASTPAAAIGERADKNITGCDAGSADFCETREFALAADGALALDATPNGGISVKSWDRDEIRVRARIKVKADGDEDRAAEIARDIRIDTDGVIQASGPRRKSWSVSYEVSVPRRTDLDLEGHNGGITVRGVSGQIDIKTVNGGLHLSSLGGEVRARTTNGGVSIDLDGGRWSGEGLDVRSTNGGVSLSVPEDYSAELSAGTVNGGLHVDFPVTVSGRIGKKIVDATLGQGGAPIKVATTNGGIHVRRN